jgi:hypothetical protein
LEKNISILAKATQVSDVAHGPLVRGKGFKFVQRKGIAPLQGDIIAKE